MSGREEVGPAQAPGAPGAPVGGGPVGGQAGRRAGGQDGGGAADVESARESPNYPLRELRLSLVSVEGCSNGQDPLVALAALAEARRIDAPAFRHEGFLEWLARDRRSRGWPAAAGGGRGGGGKGWDEVDVERIAAEIMARIDAATLAVRRVAGLPEVRRAPVAGVIGRVLERALRQGCAPWLDLAIAAGTGRDLWDEACESWVVMPAGVKRGRGGRGGRGRGQFVALTVAGDSMTPLLHSGDVILVELGSEAVRDRVVVARRPDEGFVVKCVGAVNGASIELCSLNPAFPPITVARTAHTIVGTVVLSWCAHVNRARRGG